MVLHYPNDEILHCYLTSLRAVGEYFMPVAGMPKSESYKHQVQVLADSMALPDKVY